MNRILFMQELERLLVDISEEDKIDALQYYNDYFDDAGAENEGQVIKELGSPQDIARSITDREVPTSNIDAPSIVEGNSHTNQRSSDTRYNHYKNTNNYNNSSTSTQKTKTNLLNNKLLMIILLVLALPIILPVGFAIFSSLLALMMTGVGFVIGGFASLILVHTVPGTIVATKLAISGIGLMLIALGSLWTWGIFKFFKFISPQLAHGITKITAGFKKNGGKTHAQ